MRSYTDLQKKSPRELNEYLEKHRSLDLFTLSFLWYFSLGPQIATHKDWGGSYLYNDEISQLKSKELIRIKKKIETLKKKTIETFIEAKDYTGTFVYGGLFRPYAADYNKIKHLFRKKIFNEEFIKDFSAGFGIKGYMEKLDRLIRWYEDLIARRKSHNKWISRKCWLISGWAFYIETKLQERINWELLSEIFIWFDKKSRGFDSYIEDIHYLQEQYCRYKKRYIKSLRFIVKNFDREQQYYPHIIYFDKHGIYNHHSAQIQDFRETLKRIQEKKGYKINYETNDKTKSYIERIIMYRERRAIIADFVNKYPKINEAVFFPDHSYIAK